MNLYELLLNPNVAYLFIVVGMMLTLLALLTPGTGFFEVGALFALALAGWQVYNNIETVNVWAIILGIAGMFIFLFAIWQTRVKKVFSEQQMVVLGVGIGAIVVGSIYLFGGEGLLPVINPWLGIFVSIVSAGFLWLISTKTLDIHLQRPSHDLSGLVGAIGIAKTKVHLEGTVFVDMEDWSAQSHETISEGERIRVVGRDGLILTVEKMSAPE